MRGIIRNKIGRLPPEVITEIDRKLREGCKLLTIAQWLIAGKADRDLPALDLKTGDSYSLLWTRDQTSKRPVVFVCQQALSRWTHGHYRNWLIEHRLKRPPRYDSLSVGVGPASPPTLSLVELARVAALCQPDPPAKSSSNRI
jgi:hypothetical protein